MARASALLGVDSTRSSETGTVRGLCRRNLLRERKRGCVGGEDRPGEREGGHGRARGQWAPPPAEGGGSRKGQGVSGERPTGGAAPYTAIHCRRHANPPTPSPRGGGCVEQASLSSPKLGLNTPPPSGRTMQGVSWCPGADVRCRRPQVRLPVPGLFLTTPDQGGGGGHNNPLSPPPP